MFDWNLSAFAWLFVAGFCVGFGWAIAAAIVENLKRDHS